MLMLKKSTRFALSLAIAAPMFLLPQAYADQEHLTMAVPTEMATMANDTKSLTALTPSVMPININTASQTELTVLSGIGKNKALRIVQWRELNGEFESTAQLAQVNGIGNATVAKLSGLITVTN
ncbi:MAG: competence protein ComEA [Moritella sp.]|jgi:competence protein ComEA